MLGLCVSPGHRRGRYAGNADVVGLVEAYSNKLGDAAHLWKLARSAPSRQPATEPARVVRKARRLTADERRLFIEGYKAGEPIAGWAERLGVHRTTLDNLIRRLELTREDPDAVPKQVKDKIVASYRAGETLAVIGRRHSFSQNKVQRLLVAAGESTRPRGPRASSLSAEQVAEVMQRYEAGESMGALAASYLVSYGCIRKQLLATGTVLRPRGGTR